MPRRRFHDYQKANTKRVNGGRACETRKIRHLDKGSAMDAALAASMNYGFPLRTYECEKCGGWHLTKITREWLDEEEFRKNGNPDLRAGRDNARKALEDGEVVVERKEEGVEGNAAGSLAPTESPACGGRLEAD